MAECAGGIVSNSTFSLSAALFMREPDSWSRRNLVWFSGRPVAAGEIRFDHPCITYLEVTSRVAA